MSNSLRAGYEAQEQVESGTRRSTSSAEKLIEIYESGLVTRYHTIIDFGQKQFTGQHCWGVMLVLDQLRPGGITRNLARWALYHDFPEIVTGDLPAPFKWLMPDDHLLDGVETMILDCYGIEIPLTESELAWAKAADYIECILHCMMRGTEQYMVIMDRCIEHLYNHPSTPPEAKEFLDHRFQAQRDLRRNPANLRLSLIDNEKLPG